MNLTEKDTLAIAETFDFTATVPIQGVRVKLDGLGEVVKESNQLHNLFYYPGMCDNYSDFAFSQYLSVQHCHFASQYDLLSFASWMSLIRNSKLHSKLLQGQWQYIYITDALCQLQNQGEIN